MDPVFLVWGTVVASIIAYNFLRDADRKVKRRLRKAPRRAIRHLPDGTYARFVGTVLPLDSPIEAPLTGRPCAYWRVIVEEKHGKSYSQILCKEEGRDFSIRDETDTLRVSVDGALMALEQDGDFASNVWTDPTPALERFLSKYGEKTTGILFNRSLRYHEAVIETGESVTVAGIAHAEPDPNGPRVNDGYRETPMRMVLQAGKDMPVLITDDPTVAKKRD